MVVNFTPTQQWLTRSVEQVLENKLKTAVEIGQVEIGLFNRVTLRDVRIEDHNGKDFLRAGLLSAKIELASLTRGEVNLRTISFLDGDVKLYTNKEGEPINIQFIIDAFKSKDENDKSDLNLCVNSLIVRRCNVSYDAVYCPETPGRMNPSHIDVKGFDANISLKRLTKDSLNLRIRSLKLQEKSGLDIRKLSLRMAANRRHCDVSHFELELPTTRFAKEGLKADYVLNDSCEFWRTLNVNGALDEVKLATDDIACLIPELKGLNQVVKLTADFNIKPNYITFNNLRATERNNQLAMQGDVWLVRNNGLVTKANARVNDLFVDNKLISNLYNSLTNKIVPHYIHNVGDLFFNGKVSYVKNDVSHVSGFLQTAIGQLTSDLSWQGNKVNGNINLASVNLRELFGKEDLPQNIIADITGNAEIKKGKQPFVEGSVNIKEVDFRDIVYHDIVLSGLWSKHKLSTHLNSVNDLADFDVDFSSFFDGKHFKNMNVKADVRKFAPKELRISDYFGDALLSVTATANLTTVDMKHPNGGLNISNFKMEDTEPYLLRNLTLSAVPSKFGTLLKLNSDFGSAKFDGPLYLDKFKKMLANVIGKKIPNSFPIDHSADQYKWLFDIDIQKSDFFSRVLHLPVYFKENIVAEGYLSSNGERVFVSALANDLKINSTELSNIRFLFRSRENELSSRAQLTKRFGHSDIHLEFENSTQNGRLLTDLIWGDHNQGHYNGLFKAETIIDEQKQICTKILPTEVTINDTIWNILPGEVSVLADNVDIKKIGVKHQDQSLFLRGKLSKHPEDSIVADLQQIDVQYILDLFEINPVKFSGLATGKVSVSNTFENLQLKASLDIPNFYFNDGFMGHSVITGAWGMDDKRIYLTGDMQEKGVGYTKVNGYVSPPEKCLDLHVDSKNTNVYFLNKYVGDIFGEITGRTSGSCRIYGPFKSLDFEGSEKASISAEVLATGVRYDISGGNVEMTPGKFAFSGFDMFDGEVGGGKIKGELLHDHLKNIRYNFDAETNNLLIYNKGKSIDMPFYATAYGTGKLNLWGKPGFMEANINMRPTKKTVFVYAVDSPETFGDVQLLKFNDPKDSVEVDTKIETDKIVEENTSTTDIYLNFLVDVNPDAMLKVIMDDKAGDHLIVRGSGPIKASFYNKGSFEMYGKLNVDRGTYKMSIQDVIRKDFEFTRGSYINFSGNPFEGDLGLRAIYTVNSASLADLNIGNSLSDNSVRVNCVLNFSGKVKSPQVSFDLELPTVSEDVQQMVRNLISSEEDMNMQILYLLGVGRFYTYNYDATEAAANQSQSAVAMKSFLSNTLSSQLNNIISNAVGASNWSFGANLSTGTVGWSDMEVEGILSGRLLNNRLLINGNFGYRDRPTYSNTTNFVGDFDVQYLLTPGGGVSLKAYSETNDRYFSKSSLSTQGAGILLKRDFTNFRDLFGIRKKKSKNKK